MQYRQRCRRPPAADSNIWYGQGATKGSIASFYDWFNDPDVSASKVAKALERGKGADYERIVGKVAEDITKRKP